MIMTRARWILISLLLVVLMAAAGALYIRSLGPRLKTEMIKAIERHFDSKAELQSLDVSVFPNLTASGRKLVLHYRGRKDVPPLISLDHFTARASLAGILSSPARIIDVELVGLTIQIPPDDDDNDEKIPSNDSRNSKDDSAERDQKDKEKIRPFVISMIKADGTVLKILPKKKGREPLVFELYKLTLRSVAPNMKEDTGARGRPMQYEATLKNAKPPGLIKTFGEFGPWYGSDPGKTPVSGKYHFENADLSVFKGISGKLSSKGNFEGMLEQIEVNGTTDVPNFEVRTGEPQHLKTEFHAIVDGTSGDTFLKPVVATFGRTKVICDGGVFQQAGTKGKSVILDVKMDEGRMEDIMKFAIKGKPPLIGSIRFKAKMELPPGDVDVIQKLKLGGSFGVGSAEFTSNTVQEKIETLSRRSRGEHDDEVEEKIVSNLRGNFVLDNSSITFSSLSFLVPGANVELSGSYGLSSEEIAFTGTLTMDAKLSQTQKGIKSILLKVVDPFFKGKKGGSKVPIKITGTRAKPNFGLNLGGGKNK